MPKIRIKVPPKLPSPLPGEGLVGLVVLANVPGSVEIYEYLVGHGFNFEYEMEECHLVKIVDVMMAFYDMRDDSLVSLFHNSGVELFRIPKRFCELVEP